jgi:hypothetical protein
MKTLVLLITMISSLFAFTLADVTGRWTGKVMDQFEVTYDFKQEGEALTGSTIGPDGTKIDIKDGKVKGEDVSFTLDINGMALVVTGKVKDNTMNLSFDMGGNPGAMVLTKAEK